MKAIRIIAYIGSAILILFGVLFVLAAFGPQFSGGWLTTGLILLAVGFALIVVASTVLKPKATPAESNQQVVLNIDLPGNVNLNNLKCKSCGGELSSKNISMVAGAPMVTCPYCNSVYQLTEEPKW